MNAPTLTASHLTRSYGPQTVVDDVSFELQAGSITGFLGPNGAGKTTTLRMMLGLTRPTSGSALVEGRPYAELEAPSRVVGAVLESNDFHPARSGRNHLRILAAQAGLPVSRVAEVLDLVALTKAADKPVKAYSLGMSQRLGIAGALLGEPRILVLDEPANGLDPAGVHWLRSLLRGFAEGGGTVLVSSHLLAELAQSADRVLIIAEGRLRADADLAALQRDGRTLEDAYLELTAEGAA